ncbi:MAG: hypothetical protein IPP22_09420 [Nitrosomonas sp.]|nr:hypothetical protein [Nitrosomonas sp.]
MELPENASDYVDSGFLERHEIPWFYSLDDAGGFVLGDQRSQGACGFPFMNSQRLRNMSRCLVQRKTSKINLSPVIVAGDLINYVGRDPLVVITAAHVFLAEPMEVEIINTHAYGLDLRGITGVIKRG